MSTIPKFPKKLDTSGEYCITYEMYSNVIDEAHYYKELCKAQEGVLKMYVNAFIVPVDGVHRLGEAESAYRQLQVEIEESRN